MPASAPSMPTFRLPIDPALVPIAGLAALFAALGPGQPTAVPVADAIWKAGLAAALTIAASRARPWTVLLLAGVGAATTSGPLAALAWVALVAMVVRLAVDGAETRRPRFQAAAGAAATVCLFHQSAGAFTGSTLLVGAMAAAPVVLSAIRGAGPGAQRAAGRATAVAAATLTLALAAFGLALLLAYPHLADGGDAADGAIRAARDADEAQAIAQLDASSRAFGDARRSLGQWWVRPVRLVPVLSQHLDALERIATQGRTATSSPAAVQAISGYRGLKYESGRIDLDQVRDLAAPVGATSDLLHRSGAQLDQVDQTWLVPPFAHRLDALRDRLLRTADDAATAEQVLEVMPALLGADGPRHYFVAFTTPAESRGIGGFLGNYGELQAIDGKVRMIRSGGVTDIEPARPGVRTLTGPAEFLERYGRFHPADSLRDATMSPNFPSVADVITQLYPQAGGSPVDGVLLMDPYALAALLEFTGPIEVPGYPVPLTSENLADIAVRQQYLDFAGRNDDRKDVLEDATEIAFDRLLEGDLPAPRDLIRALGPMVRQRRLMLWSPEAAEQRLFTSIGADGTMPSAGGQDAFVLTHQNFGNNKVDAYLQRSLRYRVEVDEATGEVRATATITLRNDAPAAGLPDYVIKNQRGEPRGSNVMNLTAFSPQALRSATLDGVPVTMAATRESGLNGYDLRLTVPPGGTRRLVLQLSGGVDLRSSPYRLTLVPQPSVHPDLVSVEVSGGPASECGSERRTATEARELTETIEVGQPGCLRHNP